MIRDIIIGILIFTVVMLCVVVTDQRRLLRQQSPAIQPQPLLQQESTPTHNMRTVRKYESKVCPCCHGNGCAHCNCRGYVLVPQN